MTWSIWKVQGHPRLVLLPGDGSRPREGMRFIACTDQSREDAALMLDELEGYFGYRQVRAAAAAYRRERRRALAVAR